MPENEPSEESKERIWSAFKVWLVDTIGVSDTFLTDTFMHGFTDDDDWSFVIRFHALLEAGLNHLLVTHFNDPRMNDLLSDLSTNGRTGKIAYIKRLDLLSPAARTFIRVFSVARNNAVHDVRQTRFSLRAYADALPTNERDSWRAGLSGVIGPEFSLGGEVLSTSDLADNNPRFAIFLSTVFIMGVVLQHQERAAHSRRIAQAVRELGELALEERGFSVRDLTNPKK